MRILIATDGSKFSTAAVEEWCNLFTGLNKAELKVVSVFEEAHSIAAEPFSVSAEYYQQMVDGAQKQASHFVTEAAEIIRVKCRNGDRNLTVDVLRGSPVQKIVELAKDWNANLIVVGSHGRGFWGRMLGSVSDGVVHHAPCSVLVVRKPEKN